MLIDMDKSIHEEHLSQPLQTNKQFKIAIFLLTGYNGILNVTNSNNKFCFTKSITDDGVSRKITPPGAYEIESLNNEIERTIIEEEANYPFKIKPNFSTLGSIIEISSIITGSQIPCTTDDSMRSLRI